MARSTRKQVVDTLIKFANTACPVIPSRGAVEQFEVGAIFGGARMYQRFINELFAAELITEDEHIKAHCKLHNLDEEDFREQKEALEQVQAEAEEEAGLQLVQED